MLADTARTTDDTFVLLLSSSLYSTLETINDEYQFGDVITTLGS